MTDNETMAKLSPNKLIDRLDDVIVISEEQAGEVIDRIDKSIGNIDASNKLLKELRVLINTDNSSRLKMNDIAKKIEASIGDAQNILFDAMNVLQYQDILRQKIEKVASALGVFYEFLGDFLGKGKRRAEDRAAGKHIEDAKLELDQKKEEIDKIIKKN